MSNDQSENVIGWVAGVLKRAFGTQRSVPAEEYRYYHRCPECIQVSVNAEWKCRSVNSDVLLEYGCPKCGVWITSGEYQEHRADRIRERIINERE